MSTSIKLIEKFRRLTLIQKELKAEIACRKKAESNKDELITIAGHELKTPLTIIKGYLHLLENSSSEKLIKNTRMYIARTLVQIEKLELLVTDLLDTSKIETGNLSLIRQTVNFDLLVQTVIESFRLVHPTHRIGLTGKCRSNICGDKIRLEQVIINYLTNAVKYSPDSVKIEVTVSETAGVIEFSVKDSGIGISADKQALLFHKFYRVEDPTHRFHGLGMGLYISAEIIHHQGGDVGVISEEGKGSVFYFRLPVFVNAKLKVLHR